MMVFEQFENVVVQPGDIVIGCNWIHVQDHTGNSDLWDSNHAEMMALLRVGAVDLLQGMLARLPTLLNNGRKFYFAFSPTHV